MTLALIQHADLADCRRLFLKDFEINMITIWEIVGQPYVAIDRQKRVADARHHLRQVLEI